MNTQFSFTVHSNHVSFSCTRNIEHRTTMMEIDDAGPTDGWRGSYVTEIVNKINKHLDLDVNDRAWFGDGKAYR